VVAVAVLLEEAEPHSTRCWVEPVPISCWTCHYSSFAQAVVVVVVVEEVAQREEQDETLQNHPQAAR
jgi:hypothetical protein